MLTVQKLCEHCENAVFFIAAKEDLLIPYDPEDALDREEWGDREIEFAGFYPSACGVETVECEIVLKPRHAV